MKLLSRVYEVLFAKGPSYIGPLLGAITFVLLNILPWIRARYGAITVIEHYSNFGTTFTWINLMAKFGMADAAAAFTIALTALIFALLLALLNRTLTSGLLFITSGLLLIYTFNIIIVSFYFEDLISEWTMYGFLSPYSMGPAPYAIIIIGFLFIFVHYYFKRKEPKQVT